MSNLKAFRLNRRQSTVETAKLLGIPYNTYLSLENMTTNTAVNFDNILELMKRGYPEYRQSVEHKPVNEFEPISIIVQRVEDYLKDHPGDTWLNIYNNIDSGFKNHYSLKACCNRYWRKNS